MKAHALAVVSAAQRALDDGDPLVGLAREVADANVVEALLEVVCLRLDLGGAAGDLQREKHEEPRENEAEHSECDEQPGRAEALA